ncbi:MAG: HU family DNA-binding protein [Clostridiales Family XIII bacterium]|nr:HU family DNA-binding protein [Clostridiales Family XIII bacterium]
MNKQELIVAVAEQADLTKKDADKAVNAIFDIIEKSLVKGEKVQLIGFGTFVSRQSKARKGRNPRNPEQLIDIPARMAPSFKAGKSLKDAVNKK